MRPHGNISAEGFRDWMRSNGISRRSGARILRVDSRTMHSWMMGNPETGLSNIPYAHWMILRLHVAFSSGDQSNVFDLLREIATIS